jgi:acid phosphatase (class A)
MRSSLLRSALVLALLGAGAFQPLAAQAQATTTHGQDWLAFLGPFPQPGSEAEREDVAVLLWLQRTRTREDVARALAEVRPEPGLFSAAAGVDLSSRHFALTRALLEAAAKDAGRVGWELKQHFRRPRPFLTDARIKPAVERDPSFSYPSGHGVWGVVTAAVLAELAPDRQQGLLEFGRQLGNDRVLAGVHNPSDVAGAQRLGAALVAQWLAEPAHRLRLDEVRAAEWAPNLAINNK